MNDYKFTVNDWLAAHDFEVDKNCKIGILKRCKRCNVLLWELPNKSYWIDTDKSRQSNKVSCEVSHNTRQRQAQPDRPTTNHTEEPQ